MNNPMGEQKIPYGGGFRDDVDRQDITVEDLCSMLDTDSCFGLTRSEAESRLARDGKNLVYPNRKGYDISRFLSQMFCGVSLLFWVTAFNCIICFIITDVVENETSYSVLSVFFFSVFCAIFIGAFFYAQSKNERFADTIPNMNHKVEVIRDGIRTTIPGEDVAVGDLILLKFGERIPADVRIIESQNFKVDNHTLTGIREPQQLNEKLNEGRNTALFSGTVVEGTARGIVIRTGKRTLLGQIIGSRKMDDLLVCPIVKKIVGCMNCIAFSAAILGFSLFGIYLLETEGHRFIDAFMVSVTIIIGMVPVTLFPTLIIVLHIFGRKVFLKDCKMRNVRAIQRLPFVNTICLDKPGVLTMNKALVSNLWFDEKKVEVWGGSKISLKERSSSTFRELALCAVLCSEAQFKEEEDKIPIGKRQITGSSDEVAILKFLAVTMGKKVETFREAYPKLYWGTYARFQLSVHRVENELLIILIGEPEFLLEKCTKYSMAGSDRAISSQFTEKLDKACVQFAKYGESLKCVIEKRIRLDLGAFDVHRFKLPESDCTFLGLFTLTDSPRPNIAQTIAKCREAGIQVILTTSDHPITAKTFARNIGLITEGSRTPEEKLEERGESKKSVNAVVVDGMQLKKLSKRGMQNLLAKYSEVVFARVSLIQKLMLLETFQQDNSIVAVVGDGIHDALTMKKADLSITLSGGRSDGSEPIAADVCLSEETFYSLATCIEEGRTIYENLKKTSSYLLAGILPSVLPIVAYSVFGLPLPFNVSGFAVLQIFLELFPAVALMFESSDPGTMQRPPRKLSDPVWSRQMFFYFCAQIGVIETFACFYAYFIIMLEYGWTPLSLIGIRDHWNSKYVTDLEDSYGQRWTYESRQNLQTYCQTGYFYAFISVQCANILECRNQWVSLLRLKERNWMVHFSLLLEVSLTFLIIYMPSVNTFLSFKPLKAAWLILPVPYFCLLILFDEAKKYLNRKHPQGWFARETVY